MTVALIVIAVILFIAVDVIVLRKVLGAHKSVDDHGTIPVPGEATVTLPAGKINLTYQESQHTSGGGEGEIEFYAPADLAVSVTGADGTALEIDGPGYEGTGSSKSTGAGFSRLKIGSVELPDAGAYTVRAESSQAEDRAEPQILIGA